DISVDRAKCADTLGGVITCLPYVSDQAKSPTKDCCSGFQTVLQESPQCICLLIKDRNDPGLGLQIDVPRAMSLPQICKIHTNQTVGDCPAILHLPPNSPDAQVFQQFANVTGAQTPAHAPSPVTAGEISKTPT
ncbi:non-specific lipid-transfer protein, partial [Genlisea aurea]